MNRQLTDARLQAQARARKQLVGMCRVVLGRLRAAWAGAAELAEQGLPAVALLAWLADCGLQTAE